VDRAASLQEGAPPRPLGRVGPTAQPFDAVYPQESVARGAEFRCWYEVSCFETITVPIVCRKSLVTEVGVTF
jgi:hypothetical protein